MLVTKLKEMRERKDAEDRGFTLIELLVVVVIIGILVAIAIPLYLNYQKGAHDRSAQSDLRNAIPVLNQCYSENGNAYPTTTTAFGGVTALTDMTGTITLTCGSSTETITLSADTHMYFASPDIATPADPAGTTITGGSAGSSYALDVWNTNGKSHTDNASGYVYHSTAGGTVGP